MKRWTMVVVVLLGVLSLHACVQPVAPVARFTATPPFAYPPLRVTFDASASSSPNGAIVSYEWVFGDGATGDGAVVEHTYTEKGVYEVMLVVTDSVGQTGAQAQAVEALNRMPVAVFTANKYWVGLNDPIRFDASDSYDPDGEIVQYLWSFGDGTTGEGMVVEHAYAAQAGGGWKPIVTLTVVDEDGGSGTTSRQVNVVGCASCG